jgi:gamma-glutamyltranspeptidase/glutathione hydrolase
MMSPSLLQTADGARVALGSGGSNRIRSAILQVLVRLVDEQVDLEQAITRPRIHFENDVLSVEGGFDDSVYRQLEHTFEAVHCWPGQNLFFGGVHAVRSVGADFECFGDPRRGGVAYVIS